jgi:archaellum biogenesis ATPase FlaH
MQSAALDNRGNGTAIIFYKTGLYRRIPQDISVDGKSHWLVDKENRQEEVEKKTARFLEWTYRHPRSAKTVKRFPRLLEPLTPIRDFDDIPQISSIRRKEIEWLIPALLPEGALVLLTGAPGSFKSFISLALGTALSEESEFLGRKTRLTKVLYLDRDNPLQVVASRQSILNFHDGDHLRIWGNWVHDHPPMIGDPRLLEIARRHKPVIIVDALLRFHASEENSATEMAGVMASLRQLAVVGATVIVIHHAAKAEQSKYRGSTDIVASVDIAFWLSVSRETEPSTITIECFKNRFAEEFTLTIQPDFTHGQFRVVPDPAKQQDLADVETLKALIQASPGLSQQDLIDRSKLGEGRAREILHAGTGTHWTVMRPNRKTMRYYPFGG